MPDVWPEKDNPMKLNQKWIKELSLALSLPSTILGSAFILFHLVKEKVITKEIAVIGLVLIVGQILFLMVYYAYKKKDK